MPRRLKVYGWQGHRREAPGTHQQTREIVAATSQKEAARIAGYAGPWQMFNLSETGNEDDIAQALSEPGVVFWRGLGQYGGEWRRA